MDPTDHLHLVGGAHATCAAPYTPICVAETFDGGQTWAIVNVDIPGAMGFSEQGGPYVVDDKTILFAQKFGGLMLTTDDGATWTNVLPPQVAGTSGGEFTDHPWYASATGTYSLPASGNLNGVIQSSDVMNWSWVTGSPSNGYDLGFAVGGGYVFVADDGNGDVHTHWYAKETDLSTWTALPAANIPTDAIGPQALAYDEAHRMLYSADSSAGVFRIVMP